MNNYFISIFQFLFWFLAITATLGTAYFLLIQKIRIKYKQTLPTSFHCILLKSSVVFFFVPTTVMIYHITDTYCSVFFSVENSALKETSHSFVLFQVLCIGIALFGMLKKVIHYIKVSIRLNRYGAFVSYQSTDPVLTSLNIEIRKRYGIKRTLPIYIHPYIPSPSIIGILHPKIFIPERIFKHADKETLAIILSHEFIHYKKKDIFWLHFSTLVRCIYWYLPYTKMLYNELCNWLEYDCDERCCKKNQEHYSKQDYFNTILDLLYNEKYTISYALSMDFYKNEHQVEDRILHMHAKKRTTEKNIYFCLLILMLLLLTYFISVMFSFLLSFYLF